MTTATELHLKVITPEKVVAERGVRSVRVPGVDGSFGVLKGHAPMIAAVAPGELVVEELDGKKSSFFVADGFAQVGGEEVKLVIDSGEPVTEIDLKRAEAAEKRARERIATGGDVDLSRAEAALVRALERERLSKKYRA